MPRKFVTAVLILIAAVLALPSGASAAGTLYLANGNDGTNGQAQVFPLDSSGLPQASIQTYTSGEAGYYNGISVSPDGKVVVLADYNADDVVSFTVGADGKLTQAPGSPKTLAPGSGPYGTAITPDGRFAIIGDYDRRGVEAVSIGADGSLTQVPGGFIDLGPSVLPYMVAVSVDGNTVYVPDPNNDAIHALRLAANGTMTPIAGSPFPGGDEPYMVAVTPDGEHLYMANYGTPDTVSAYSIAADGSLTPVAGSPFPTGSQPYGGIAITPNGRALYISGNNRIDVATINADGSLTAGTPVPASNYNPGLAVSPDGNLLYNTVDGVHKLDTFSIGAGGSLAPVGTPVDVAATSNFDVQSLVARPNQPPVAALTASSGKGNQVSFDASGSSDPDGSITSYRWDFGDGQTATTTVPTTSHTYASAGTYPATVTLTDNEGCSTALVFTGQTAYCNGSGVARASVNAAADDSIAGAKVQAKKTQKQKGKKIKVAVKAGADEKVTAEATGSVAVPSSGKKLLLKKKTFKLSKVTASIESVQQRTLKLSLKPKKANKSAFKAIDSGKKLKASVTVKLTDERGNSATKKLKVKLK